MIYRLRILGREIASLEIAREETPEPQQTDTPIRISGGANHNFEMSYAEHDSQAFGFHA